MKSITCLAVLSAAALFGVVSCASIASNLVVDATPRIATSEQLLSSIVNEWFEDDLVMNCLKGKVLVYLDGVLGLREEQVRAFEEQNVDKVIFDRVARILATHEFKVQLPEDTVVSYRADKGVNLDVVPAGLATESRGHLLKKKLLLPVLLLLKLKMKALMPIFVALIGLKAMKALILSKLAITLVLGFIVAQLVKKSGLGMPMMSMMPMMPPAAEYGAPAPATTEPPSSYGAPSWESQSGGPYSRVWEPSTSSSSHNLAYSSYYPSGSSSSYSSTAYNSGSSTSSSSSPSSS
ncbi:AAEL014727-PA, partial [Aedes aegypti]